MTNRNYYINGNTVRELETSPARKPKENPRENEEQKRRARRKNAARRNRERALYMSKGYVKVQADVTQRMKTIASLESQITDLRADNDANYKRITTSVDLNEIKDIAMNQLGMTYASEDQIIYYSVENSNYMDQYSDIPEK
jgi:hypothetical protein